MQFKDMLYALSASLAAGNPVEEAFKKLPQDLFMLYPDENESIILETRLIAQKIRMNMPVEDALDDFAVRSGLEDIKNFSDVFRISKRAGANMVDVIRNTTNIINDRIEIAQEIETVLAERKFEQKVLYAMTPAMVILLSVAAPDYIKPVFSSLAGYAVMTVALVLAGLALAISARINDIKL